MSTKVNQTTGQWANLYDDETTAQTSILRVGRAGSRPARYQQRILIGILACSDALMIGFALLAGWYIRIESGLFAYHSEGPLDVYLQTIVVAIPLLLSIFMLNGLYDYEFLLGGTKEYEIAVRACTYGVVALVFVSFIWREWELSRGWLIASWSLATFLVCTSRFLWRRFFRGLRSVRGWFVTPTLIVGANSQGCAIARQMDRVSTGMEIIGFVDDFLPPGAEVIEGKFVLGASNQLYELVTAHRAGYVIVIQNGVAWETYHDILQRAVLPNHFELLLSPGFYEILATGVQLTTGGFVPLLRVNKARITGPDLILKTLLDFSLGTLLLIVTSPLILVSAIALWLSMGFPILKRYEVMGLGGRPFRTTKFRTGFHGTAYRRLSGTTQYLATDLSGRSRVGGLLYRSGLDKLPQLFDVVRGRMSLVGPRAVSPRGGGELRHESLNLLTLKPGWTGLWAVGDASSLEDEMRLTMYYIRNWTIWLDLQVLFRTAKLAVAGQSRTPTGQETTHTE